MWASFKSPAFKPWEFLRRNYSKNISSDALFINKIKQAELKRKQSAPEWVKREETLRKRYGQWNPTRKLSRQQIMDIKNLKEQYPGMKTKQLADFFEISPESIRRILKSKWEPTDEEMEDLKRRTAKRKLFLAEKKAATLENQSTTTATPGGAKKSPGSYTKKYAARKNYKNGNKKTSKKPYTHGVGDLID